MATPCPYDIDTLRREGFTRLAATFYLDWAGAALHDERVLRLQTNMLNSVILSNPHSQTSVSGAAVEQCRRDILSYFGGSPTTHHVVFASNSTSALKMLAQAFAWTKDSSLCYARNSHTSVIGMRALAPKFSVVDVGCAPAAAVDHPSLFVYAAQGNFAGRKMSASLIAEARHKGYSVCVDAASMVSSSHFSLKEWDADFVNVSFYKMFGYPDGVGALIVSKRAVSLLPNKLYFGGGTVESVLVDEEFVSFRKDPSARLEDGTLPFLSIACLRFGFDLFNSLGIQNIQRHTFEMAQWLAAELLQLVHPTGRKACVLYGNWETPGVECTMLTQGPIIALNFVRPDGTFYGYSEVAKLANLHDIMVRTGCFCASGACGEYLGIDSETTKKHFSLGHVCWDDNDVIDGIPTGTVRVSLGYASNRSDTEAFLLFARECFIESGAEPKTVASQKEAKAVLKQITLFPVKSCAGISVEEWPLGNHGLLFDREWVIAGPNGVHLSQKKVPALALIHPELDLDARVLRLSACGLDPLVVSLDDVPSGQLTCLTVCGDSSGGLAYGDDASSWISRAVGRPCILLRATTKSQRKGTQRWKKDANVSEQHKQALENATIAYSNEAQFLVMSQASIEDVRSRLKQSLPNFDHRRFRPNFVIEGCPAYQEDAAISICIGDDVRLLRVGPCSRCQMVCVDPETAQVTKEPLKTLASYRRSSGKILMGTLFAVARSAEESPQRKYVSVGDSVAMVLE